MYQFQLNQYSGLHSFPLTSTIDYNIVYYMNGDIISISVIDNQLISGILNYASIFEITDIKFFGICKQPHTFDVIARLCISVDKNSVMAPLGNIKKIKNFILEHEELYKYLK